MIRQWVCAKMRAGSNNEKIRAFALLIYVFQWLEVFFARARLLKQRLNPIV